MVRFVSMKQLNSTHEHGARIYVCSVRVNLSNTTSTVHPAAAGSPCLVVGWVVETVRDDSSLQAVLGWQGAAASWDFG